MNLSRSHLEMSCEIHSKAFGRRPGRAIARDLNNAPFRNGQPKICENGPMMTLRPLCEGNTSQSSTVFPAEDKSANFACGYFYRFYPVDCFDHQLYLRRQVGLQICPRLLTNMRPHVTGTKIDTLDCITTKKHDFTSC